MERLLVLSQVTVLLVLGLLTHCCYTERINRHVGNILNNIGNQGFGKRSQLAACKDQLGVCKSDLDLKQTLMLAFVPERSCHVQLENNFGTFSPPDYSGNVNLWCNWTIIAGPGKHIVVYIKGFQADASCDENWDEIIFEGVSSAVETSVVYACWNKNIHVFAAQATAVHVVFFWLSSHVPSKKYFEGSYYIFEDPTSVWPPDKPIITSMPLSTVYSDGTIKQKSDNFMLSSTVFPYEFKQTRDMGSMSTIKRIKLFEKQKEREPETSSERKITSSVPPTEIKFINGLLRNGKTTLMAQHKDILSYWSRNQQLEEEHMEMRSLNGVQQGSINQKEPFSKLTYRDILATKITKHALPSNIESAFVQSMSFASSSADTLFQISSIKEETGKTQELVSEMMSIVPTSPSFISPTEVTYEKSLAREISDTFISQSIPSYWKGSQQVDGTPMDVSSLDDIQTASMDQKDTSPKSLFLYTVNEQEHTLAKHIPKHTLQSIIESTFVQALLFAPSTTDTFVQISSLKKEIGQTQEQDSELMTMIPIIPTFISPTEVTYEQSLPREKKNSSTSPSHGIPSYWKGIPQTEELHMDIRSLDGLQTARIDHTESMYLSTVNEQGYTLTGHFLQQSNIESSFGQTLIFSPSSTDALVQISSFYKKHSQTQEIVSSMMSSESEKPSFVTPATGLGTFTPWSDGMSSQWNRSHQLDELYMEIRSLEGVQESVSQYLLSMFSEQEHVLSGDTTQHSLQSDIESTFVQSLSFSPDFTGIQPVKFGLSFSDAPVKISCFEEQDSIMTLGCLALSSMDFDELDSNPSKSLELTRTPWFSEISQLESVMAVEEYIKLAASQEDLLSIGYGSLASKKLSTFTVQQSAFHSWRLVSSSEEFILSAHSRILAETELDKIPGYKAGIGHKLTTNLLENTPFLDHVPSIPLSPASSIVYLSTSKFISSQFTSSINDNALDSTSTDSLQIDYPLQDILGTFSDIQKRLDTLLESPYSTLVAISHVFPESGHGHNGQSSQMVGTEYVHNHLVPSGESSFGESLREATLLIASATKEIKTKHSTQYIQFTDREKLEMQISDFLLSTEMPKMSSYLVPSGRIEQATVATHFFQISESQPRPRGHTPAHQEIPITTSTEIIEAKIQSTYPYQPFYEFDYVPLDRPRTGIIDMSPSFGNIGNKTDLGFPHFPGDRLFAITAEVRHNELLPLGLETYLFKSVHEELPEATFFLPVGIWEKDNRTTNDNTTILNFWLHLKRGGRGMENFTETNLRALVNSSVGKLNATLVSFSAEDVNECQMEIHQCDIQANCTNENGTYSCQCKDGYKDKSPAALGTVCIKFQNSVHRLLYIQLEVLIGSIVAVAVVLFIIFTLLCSLLQNRYVKGNLSVREANPAISQLGRLTLDPSPQRDMGYMISTGPEHMCLQYASERHTGQEGPGTLEMMKITVEQTAC
ncbi:uncharacterized protein LOC108716591 [Xenopus laevis]|uniref:Uncharacterized protein LOC108716591 n=2 Tax=Xenopus laevis TaxID=8355 RepID=A0A1L8G729_XENLA|nr:uncharacterized protein LOC108716591 [Xenopus laevis]XP_018118324.1 uncharacterized protein LOC108716591 [Xenopus laevis]XP_018118325.1 uncharacterized protein LOC108716591 [Xenopus laevis]OCT79707.1 hypothetical protein XELAEV_18026515mg [Xenopus laevis]